MENGKLATRDGVIPKWASQLRTWGEAGVVKEGKDGKTGDRGVKMMFVGYPSNRESDSKRMFNPDTHRVVTTRDVIWLHEMYYGATKDSSTVIGQNKLRSVSTVHLYMV